MHILFLLLSFVAAQEAGPSWLRSRTLANALNPRISAIADMVGTSGPNRATSGGSLREVEIGFQSEVDPYGRLDLFVAKPESEAVEIEEAYVTLTTLPWGLGLRGGKLLPSFGRLNMVHGHELHQVDKPLAVESFLGPEGLRDVGVELSKAFAPLGLYTELSYAFLNTLGEAAEEEPATATVADVDGNNVTVRTHEEEAKHSGKLRDYAHVARARLFADITDEANVEVGASGALHQPKGQMHRSLLGTDLTFRWKPTREGLYKSFVWRSEMLWSRRRLADEFDLAGAQTATAAKVDKRGAYSYAQYQWDRRWAAGLRGDYAEDPGLRNIVSVTRAASPYVTFTLSEFNRFRLQYQRQWLPTRKQDDRVQLQWTVVLGPHGAHPY